MPNRKRPGTSEPINLGQARRAMEHANQLGRDIERFEAQWPKLPTTYTAFPSFSWEQLERQVLSLAAQPDCSETSRAALEGWRVLAWSMPPEMVLREVLIVAWAAMDESFQPDAVMEPEINEGEAPMP